MASYRDLLRLVREGKSNQEIQDALAVGPAAMQRLLASKKLKHALQADRELTSQLAEHRLLTAADRLVQRCLQIAEADDDETARRVAMELMERARRLLDETRPQPKVPLEKQKVEELVRNMVSAGMLPRMYLGHTEEGELEWECSLRTGEPLDIDFRKVEYATDDDDYLTAYNEFRDQYDIKRKIQADRRENNCDECELDEKCKALREGCLKK